MTNDLEYRQWLSYRGGWQSRCASTADPVIEDIARAAFARWAATHPLGVFEDTWAVAYTAGYEQAAEMALPPVGGVH